MEAKVLHEGRATFSLDLHPAYSNNALEGVKAQLESRLLRWDDGLEGVLLAYKNLQKLPTQATIRPYFPYIKLSVAADVLIFRPGIGAILCGQVTKLGADYIGMTVLGSVNAAVGRQNIRTGLQYHPESECWEASSSLLEKIELGCDVLFCIDGVRIERNGVLAVLGSMKEAWAGAIRAAATTWPNAFPDPARWQTMAPQPPPLLLLPSPLSTPGAGQPLVLPAAQQGSPAAAVADTQQTAKKAKSSSQPAIAKQGDKPTGHSDPAPVKTQLTAEQPRKKRKRSDHVDEAQASPAEPSSQKRTQAEQVNTPAEQPRKATKQKSLANGSLAATPQQHDNATENMEEQLRKKKKKKIHKIHKNADDSTLPSDPPVHPSSPGTAADQLAIRPAEQLSGKEKKRRDKAAAASAATPAVENPLPNGVPESHKKKAKLKAKEDAIDGSGFDDNWQEKKRRKSNGSRQSDKFDDKIVDSKLASKKDRKHNVVQNHSGS